MRFLLLGFIISSCSSFNPEFTPYVAKFKEDSLKYGRKDLQDFSIPIEFATLSNKDEEYQVVGLCRYIPFMRAIFIDERFWRTSSETMREIVLYHELGHCVLDKDHDEETDLLGIPKHLMYPSVLSSRNYEAKKDYYLKDLFKK